MVKDISKSLMEVYTREIILMMLLREKESTNGQMVKVMKGNM